MGMKTLWSSARVDLFSLHPSKNNLTHQEKQRGSPDYSYKVRVMGRGVNHAMICSLKRGMICGMICSVICGMNCGVICGVICDVICGVICGMNCGVTLA